MWGIEVGVRSGADHAVGLGLSNQEHLRWRYCYARIDYCVEITFVLVLVCLFACLFVFFQFLFIWREWSAELFVYLIFFSVGGVVTRDAQARVLVLYY